MYYIPLLYNNNIVTFAIIYITDANELLYTLSTGYANNLTKLITANSRNSSFLLLFTDMWFLCFSGSNIIDVTTLKTVDPNEVDWSTNKTVSTMFEDLEETNLGSLNIDLKSNVNSKTISEILNVMNNE